VAVALFLGDRPGAAIATLCVGAVVASLDNFVRPVLARYGQLQLPTYLVFVAMLGGVVSFGPGGLLLGPLFVRLVMEGLMIGREH
jgi:predicted PurR-regulated permease PerM